MNATGQYKSLVLLLGLSLVAGIACPLSAQTPGQSSSATAKETPRQQVDQWLTKARQAIKAGELTRADKLVAQAEAAGVRFVEKT